MLKASEQRALRDWWQRSGRYSAEGALAALVCFGVPVALVIGFTVN